MERTQVLNLMGELKLYGMRQAYDEIMDLGIKRQHEPQKSTWHTRTNVCATHAEPEVVTRLRVGPVHRLPPLQGSDSD
jgi:hypothetical protein